VARIKTYKGFFYIWTAIRARPSTCLLYTVPVWHSRWRRLVVVHPGFVFHGWRVSETWGAKPLIFGSRKIDSFQDYAKYAFGELIYWQFKIHARWLFSLLRLQVILVAWNNHLIATLQVYVNVVWSCSNCSSLKQAN